MNKNNEIKLIGQPIYGQLLKLIDKWNHLKNIVREIDF